ncbi:glucose-6-phosphate dehydrogenase [Aureococcus anophagefferens]|nr:glucose-6-phosphate dehydrogenase [Aureococcus anophagefferens]
MNDAPETSTPDAPSEVEKLRSRVAELELRLAPGAAAPVDALGGAAWTSLVIFGADGNLATKKTYPTLFALWRKRLLPPDVVILGYARADLTVDDFRKRVYRAIYDSAHAQRERASFLERCAYVAGQFDDAAHVRGRLRPELERLEAAQAAPGARGRGGAAARVRVYYMAVPPFLYGPICRSLRGGGLRGGGTADRFVLEKPFGRDAASCRALCAELGALLREDEAYRIDHYLGKELVMNVLVLRFANVCFEGIWDRTKVARVDICCFETISTLGRGGYFDAYGIIRDVLQNHLAQILALVGAGKESEIPKGSYLGRFPLALVAMEQPLSFGAADVKREKVKVLRSVRPLDAEHDLVVGQFDGYADDPSALEEKKVEVRIRFHAVAGAVADVGDAAPNELVVRVQPDECIYWRVMNRVPGLHTSLKLEPRRMNLLYTPSESRDMPDAYERFLLEVLRGDATNFVGVDELDAAWAVFSPALAALAARTAKPERSPAPGALRGPAPAAAPPPRRRAAAAAGRPPPSPDARSGR